jgi:uncharacterized membrane protein YkvA (DUF1232 family)
MATLTFGELWDKVRHNLPRLPFIEDAVASYYCAIDPLTPAAVKAVLFGALAYFVSPIDLCPDVLALVGFTDDAAVLAAAIASVRAHLGTDHYQKAHDALQKLAS